MKLIELPPVADWNIEKMTGYKPLTSYYRDFSYAEHLDEPQQEIVNYYNELKAMLTQDLRNNYKEFTELVMVLNWKIWEHYKHNDKLAQLYNHLWEKADLYAQDNLKDEELNYFYRTTD